MANHATVVHSTENRVNPGDRPPMFRALVAIIVLGVIGLGISGYLTYTHFNEAALVCSVGGCETVQSSQYSTIGPVPVAMLGVAMFAAIIGMAGIRLSQRAIVSDETVSMLAWGMLLTGILYYVYLTYVELFVLNAICQWCVLSSFAAVGIFGLESAYLYRAVMSDDPLDAV
jgi:uncharacterized membrane protein